MSRTLLLTTLLLVLAGPAFAGPADDLINKGTEAYQNEDYDGALASFLKAQETAPSPDLLYNIARVYEAKGDYSNATEYYKKFIAIPNADVDARSDALKRLKIVRELMEPEKKPDPVETPKDTTKEGGGKEGDGKEGGNGVVTPPPETGAASSGPSPLSWVFLGLGVAFTGAGTYFGLTASGQGADLRNVCVGDAELLCPSSAQPTLDGMRQNALFADISFGAAGLFALTGIVTLVLTSGGGETETSSISPIVTPDGAGVSWSLRF